MTLQTARLSRGTQEDFTRIEYWATVHGKTLIIVDGPQYPARGDSDYWRWAAEKRTARVEWEAGRERSMRAQQALRVRGKLVGRPPFGYDSAGAKYDHHLVPNSIGWKYVPEIFDRCIKGESLRAIALWLTAEGVRTNSKAGQGWEAKTVGQILRNATYMGHRQDASGKTEHRCEGIVDADVFRRAGESLARRPKRGPVNEATRAMLPGCLKCLLCGAPMYRVNSRGVQYYRCAGKGPVRRSECKNLVRCDVLDAQVSVRVAHMTQHITRTTLVPGHDHAAELADVDFELKGLAAQGFDEDAEDAERARLRAERKRLAALPSVPDRFVEEDTGESYASRLTGLGDGERAAWLRSMKKQIYAFNGTEDRLAAAVGTRGCPISAEDDSLPPEVGGVYVYTGTWLKQSMGGSAHRYAFP